MFLSVRQDYSSLRSSSCLNTAGLLVASLLILPSKIGQEYSYTSLTLGILILPKYGRITRRFAPRDPGGGVIQKRKKQRPFASLMLPLFSLLQLLENKFSGVFGSKKRHRGAVPLYFFFFVGVAGFEPATPCSQSRCANRTALHPDTLILVLRKKWCKIRTTFIINKLFSLFLPCKQKDVCNAA